LFKINLLLNECSRIVYEHGGHAQSQRHQLLPLLRGKVLQQLFQPMPLSCLSGIHDGFASRGNLHQMTPPVARIQ
jgi:hypothetical protein